MPQRTSHPSLDSLLASGPSREIADHSKAFKMTAVSTGGRALPTKLTWGRKLSLKTPGLKSDPSQRYGEYQRSYRVPRAQGFTNTHPFSLPSLLWPAVKVTVLERALLPNTAF